MGFFTMGFAWVYGAQGALLPGWGGVGVGVERVLCYNSQLWHAALLVGASAHVKVAWARGLQTGRYLRGTRLHATEEHV